MVFYTSLASVREMHGAHVLLVRSIRGLLKHDSASQYRVTDPIYSNSLIAIIDVCSPFGEVHLLRLIYKKNYSKNVDTINQDFS